MTPGIQPQRVSKKIIINEPQPFPITDKGGKIIANNTLKKLIYNLQLVYIRRVCTDFVTKEAKPIKKCQFFETYTVHQFL